MYTQGESTLKARLYDLTEERDKLQKEVKQLQEHLEKSHDNFRTLKNISDNRADFIKQLIDENRNSGVDVNKLADDVSGAFSKQGIDIF